MSAVDELVEEYSLDELKDMADDRGVATYGTKADIASRIVEHDAASADDPDSELAESDIDDDVAVEESADVGPSEGPGFGGLAEGESARAGGWINRGDGKGWVLDDTSKEHPPADPRDDPVNAGKAGLPGNPAMATAVETGR